MKIIIKKFQNLDSTMQILLMVAATVAVLTGITGLHLVMRGNNPIPVLITESVTFPLYYPNSLPAGYRISQESFEVSNQVIMYSLTKEGAPTILITIQAKPSGFDFEDFHLKKMTGSKEVLTSSGKAVIGTYNGRTVGSLAADKSWVIVNAPEGVSAKDVELISKGLKPLSE